MTRYWTWAGALYRQDNDARLEFLTALDGWGTSSFSAEDNFYEFAEEVFLADIIESGFLVNPGYRKAVLSALI